MGGDIFSALEIRTWTFLEAIILPTTLEFKTPTISFLVNMCKLNCPVPQFPHLVRAIWGLNTVDPWIAWELGLLIPWAVENPHITTSWPSTKHRFPTADFKTHVIQLYLLHVGAQNRAWGVMYAQARQAPGWWCPAPWTEYTILSAPFLRVSREEGRSWGRRYKEPSWWCGDFLKHTIERFFSKYTHLCHSCHNPFRTPRKSAHQLPPPPSRLPAFTDPLCIHVCFSWTFHINGILKSGVFMHLDSFTWCAFEVHCCNMYFVPFYCQLGIYCMDLPDFVFPFVPSWIFGLFSPFGYCD